MEEGTVLAWRKQEGDAVNKGDVLCEIESDKSVFELESPGSGFLNKILVKSGKSVAVQELIAIVGSEKDSAISVCRYGAVPEPDSGTANSGRIKISPKAKKLAETLGIDYTSIAGTGPGERIESRDIERAAHNAVRSAEKKQTQPSGTSRKTMQEIAGIASEADLETIPYGAGRKRVIDTVVRSVKEIPQFSLHTSIDVTGLVEYRKRRIREGEKLSYNAFFMRAAVKGIEAEPSMQYLFSERGFLQRNSVDIGLAVDTPRGVVIGTVHDVDKLSLSELSQSIEQTAEACRTGKAAASGADACMTVSNLGMHRVDGFVPIVYPGQTAIIGIGTIAERPVALNSTVQIRTTVLVTLCADHRIADGAAAARFLSAFAEFLESYNST